MSTATDRNRSGGPPPPARFLSGAVGFGVLSALALVVVNLGARASVPEQPPEELGWLEAWIRYDSIWYFAIVRDGYFFIPDQQSSVAFFPTYPVLMWLGGPALGVYLTGVIVTLAAGLTSVLLLIRWCVGRVSGTVAMTAVGLLLVYPYSLYLYGAVYADALFLACALGAFLLLDGGRPWLAGLVGILATAGRPVGVAVAIGLVLRVLELAHQRGMDAGEAAAPDAPPDGPRADAPPDGRRAHIEARLRQGRDALQLAVRRLRFSDAGVLLSVAGLGGYMVYQWVSFGTPVAFVLTESAPGWDQGTGPESFFKISFIYTMLYGSPFEIARLVLPALLCLGALLLLPRVLRRFGWGYAAFTAVVVLIPVVGTKDFMGSGRYLLVAFPLFVVLAELLVDSWPRAVRVIVLPVSATILAVFTALYGYGLEVS